jgi:DNA-binding NarL/FixJ family response regulator
VWWDIPKRLSTEEVISMLEALLQRGRDKKKRKMNPNSLANLRPTKPFTPGHSPSKPRKLTDEQLNEAIELRANGCSWRKVGDILKCNHQTVRSSLRRRGEQKPNSGEITKLLTGDEMPSSYHPTLEGCSTR